MYPLRTSNGNFTQTTHISRTSTFWGHGNCFSLLVLHSSLSIVLSIKEPLCYVSNYQSCCAAHHLDQPMQNLHAACLPTHGGLWCQMNQPQLHTTIPESLISHWSEEEMLQMSSRIKECGNIFDEEQPKPWRQKQLNPGNVENLKKKLKITPSLLSLIPNRMGWNVYFLFHNFYFPRTDMSFPP